MKKNKVLIVAAHPDDEVLGVGATIAKHTAIGDKVDILLLSEGETARDTYNIKKRLNQAVKVAKFLGANNMFSEEFPDNQMDTIPLLTIAKTVERILDKVKPNIIYTHFAHDLNIDHRKTFQAVLTACRPQPNLGVEKIFSFEVLSSTGWQNPDQQNSFCPNMFNNVSQTLEMKIRAMKIYRQEIRTYPHPRSLKGIRVLAQYRGMQSGFLHAEAFQLVRNLVD